jgi:deferrochelatase/peroxidase EfeB
LSSPLPTRRGFLGLAVLAGLAACGSPRAADTGLHPALRRPEPFGEIALLAATSGAGGAPNPGGGAGELRAAVAALARGAGAEAMVGVSSAFFDAAGLVTRRPSGLVPMPAFPGDVLTEERSGAAVLVQVEGDSAAGVARRIDQLLSAVGPGLAVSWRTAVHRDAAGVRAGRALQRNPFGFVEGQANPELADPAPVLTADGSSLVAVRVIRMAHELWDADGIARQERVIGRRRDGTWLDGTDAAGQPRFADDPHGAVTPLDSHVRRANPRTPDAPAPRMLRRSWSYDGGPADRGVVFMAFQNDLTAGFLRAQQRLPGEALGSYLLTVGGGFFLVPPPTALAALVG